MKTIVLPKYKRKMYLELARLTCAINGEAATKEKIEKLINHYANEDVKHSLTPNPRAGKARRNPGTPAIAQKTKKLMSFFKSNESTGNIGLFDQKLSTDEAREMTRRFESATVHLAHIYMYVLGKQTKAQTAYGKNAGESDRKRAELLRYFRVYVWVMILKSLELVFKSSPDAIWGFIETELHASDPMTTHEFLKDPQTRAAFVARAAKKADQILANIPSLV